MDVIMMAYNLHFNKALLLFVIVRSQPTLKLAMGENRPIKGLFTFSTWPWTI